MYAIRQYEFGPPSVLRYEAVPDPVVGDGQVLIDVAASGVHVLDTVIRAGVSGGPFPLPDLPMTPGREVAGQVAEVGPGVDPGWAGRRVVAHLGQTSGGYAQRAVVAASAVHDIDGLDAGAAVALIGTGRTAAALLEAAAIGADDVVLVTSAAGGMGNLIVQSARHAGAVVVGLAGGPAKAAQVAQFGAFGVDYRAAGWPEQVSAALAGRAPTVLVDAWGGPLGETAADLLADGGRLVRFGAADGQARLATRGVRTTVVTGAQITRRPGGVRELETAALAAGARGEWAPLVQRFPLAEAAAAHAALEDRRTTGKVVLVA